MICTLRERAVLPNEALQQTKRANRHGQAKLSAARFAAELGR
jgi:hypothetical protein